MSNNTRIIAVACLLVCSCLCSGASYYIQTGQYEPAYERQNTEEELAREYLAMLQSSSCSSDGEEASASASTPPELDEPWLTKEEPADCTEAAWTDDNYYERDGVTYTPDYAKGYLDCVLTIPSIELCRGVYTGTWEEIAYDLDIWMVTTARSDYVLGETHYCIYGHNHTAQDLSFNRLSHVKVGDIFTLTSTSGEYVYEVTDVFAVWREQASSDYVDNFTLSADKCYIITCGRNEHRYKDLIIEGTIIE